VQDGTPAPERITLDDVVRAIGFLSEYVVPMARRAFGEAALPEPERDARRLARWYLRQPHPRPAVVGECQDSCRLDYVMIPFIDEAAAHGV
jgi:hypothetical protein